MDFAFRKGYVTSVCSKILCEMGNYDIVESLSVTDYDDRVNSYIQNGGTYSTGTPCTFVGQPKAATIGRIMKYGINGVVICNEYLSKARISNSNIVMTDDLIKYAFSGCTSKPSKSAMEHVKWLCAMGMGKETSFDMDVGEYDPSPDSPGIAIKFVNKMPKNPEKFIQNVEVYTSENGEDILIPIPRELSAHEAISNYHSEFKGKTLYIYKDNSCVIYNSGGIKKAGVYDLIRKNPRPIAIKTAMSTAIIEKDNMSFINKVLEDSNFKT